MYNINRDTIVQDPHPGLRTKCEPVSFPMSKEDIATMEDMLKYVRDSRVDELAEKYNLQPANGIAAPQVGVLKQMTVIVVDQEVGDDEYVQVEYALVNPRIISHSKKQSALEFGEGCLSIQQVHEGLVPRHWRIKVHAFDYLRQEEVIIEAKDLLSIVLQHEIDHLNGILFYDHINKENPWSHDGSLKIIEY